MIPAFTFAATAAAVELCGYQPYLPMSMPIAGYSIPTGAAARERDRIGIVVPLRHSAGRCRNYPGGAFTP